MRWHVFRDFGAERMHAVVEGEVFPFIKTLSDGGAFARYMATATFGISNPVTLQRAVTGIDELMKDYVSDIADLGDLYEYMLSELSVSGQNGQFRTPQHIRKMMVELVDPKPGELICDSRATELLFVALFIRMLRIGGRCACVVPNGVLFRTNSKAYRQLRKELVDHQRLQAIIYMPSGVFKPYSGVSTAVLVSSVCTSMTTIRHISTPRIRGMRHRSPLTESLPTESFPLSRKSL